MADDVPFGDVEAALAGFDQNPDMLVIAAGPDHRTMAVSARMRAWLPREQLIGTVLGESWGELGVQALEKYDACYRTGEVQHGHEWRFHVDPGDGEPTDAYVSFVMTPWRDEHGAVVGVIGQGTDVTERVRRRHVNEGRARSTSRALSAARETVSALQEALLPIRLPVLQSLDVSASYLLAGTDTAAGGDWYDVVPTDGGRVALVVGDVVGHGVTASAVMGQLRAALAATLLHDDDPGRALEHLDRYAWRLPEARAATVCVAVVDPVTGEVRYCTAGHPPPLLLSERGAGTRFLATSGAAPLGIGSDFPVVTVRLAPRDALLLYSDGLVERPGRTPAQGTLELSRTAAAAYAQDDPDAQRMATTERVCGSMLDQLVRATGHRDDVTLLCAQVLPAPVPPLDVTLPAEPRSVPAARAELADWLDRLRVDTESTMAFSHAVGEVVTNAVEHAYADDPADPTGAAPDASGEHVRMRVELDDAGSLVATVSDGGRWRQGAASRREGRGLGLIMADQFVDHLEVVQGEEGGGTVVRLRLEARRAAQLFTSNPIAGPTSIPAPEPPSVVLADPEVDPRFADGEVPPEDLPITVEVAGAIDLTVSDELRRTLSTAHVRAGKQRVVTVDLADVTLLASGGVQVLAEALSGSIDESLVLYAPVGSPAQHVLELVQLPYRSKLAV